MEFVSIFGYEHLSNLSINYIIAAIATIAALFLSSKYALKFFCRSGTGTSSREEIECDETNLKDFAESQSDHPNDGDGEKVEKEEDAVPSLSPRYPDPVDYCEHIQGEIKRVQQKVATKSIAKTLTEDQLQEEKEIQRQQLAEIFRLMQEQQDRFGIGTMDDMQEQMKLYAV